MLTRFFASVMAAMVLMAGLTDCRAGMVFNLIDTGGAGVGTQARAGFQTAADYWSSKFNDNIVLNLQIGMKVLASGTLGGADLETLTRSYTDYRTAALSDATSADDSLFTSNLPNASAFSVFINRTSNSPNGALSATPYVDNDGDANNTTVRMARANARALGLLSANDAALDATIEFNSSYSFDYDPTNGISSGTFDFVGIAIHEIGHALGFFSGVDILDIDASGSFPDEAYTWVTPLDFTRFSAASQSAGADIDWTADSRPKYFSIDGGTTVAVNNAWSLGKTYGGSGRQASHWNDDLGLGIMDPTFAPGELGVVTNLDLRAFDIMGFNSTTAVPEPTSMAIFAGGLVLLACRRRLRESLIS